MCWKSMRATGFRIEQNAILAVPLELESLSLLAKAFVLLNLHR